MLLLLLLLLLVIRPRLQLMAVIPKALDIFTGYNLEHIKIRGLSWRGVLHGIKLPAMESREVS